MIRCLLAILTLFAMTSQARAEAPLRLSFMEFPPMYEAKENGAWGGEMLDLFGRITDKLGMTYAATVAPTPRVVQNLVDGTADVALVVPTLFTGKDVLIGAADAVVLDLRVYAIGEDPAVASMEDLRGKSVILMLGYSYGAIRPFIMKPENNVKISVEARSHEQSLAALVGKRGDYLLNYENLISRVVKSQPVEGLKSRSLSKVPVRLIVTKTRPDAPALLEKLEKAMIELKAQN